MITDRLKVETQEQQGQLSFLTYWHGHHALEFIYQTACREFDLDLRSDIDLALRMLFKAECCLPAATGDYLPGDATTPVVEGFSGIESSIRYERGWIDPTAFDADALNEVNEAMQLLIHQLKPSVGSDLELCFTRVFKAFQSLAPITTH